jgi:hypothetical protein
MGDIPKDIMRSADAAFVHAIIELDNVGGSSVAVIARAIMAERQRCAMMAGKWADDDLQNGETRLASAYIRREILTAS